jgi:hypothetical protein
MTSLAHEPVVLERPSFFGQTRDEPSTSAGGSADVAAADPPLGKGLPPGAVLKAVNSLYDDELRPNLGLVRRRLKELYDVLVPITELRKLIHSLVKAKILSVQGDPQEPVLAVRSRPVGSFVDPMDPDVPYDTAIFQRMQVLMDAVAASDPQRLYKGGRYGMAQQLRSMEMPELQDFSLGQVCHIVQLAISKKIVGYKKGGALVPYKLSDSCVKNSAESSDSNSVDLLPTIKSVAELRTVLMVLWMNPEHHAGLQLSLVKDKIEQTAKRTLSEHQLGFSKLSHLFSMAELEGCCELRHEEPFQPVLCPPSLVTANGVAKPCKTAGKASNPLPNEVPWTAAPASEEAVSTPPVPPASWPQRPADAPLPPPPLLAPMPPIPHWPAMLAAMPSPMTIEMVTAHMESLGAGLESSVPPMDMAEVPEGLSLGPEAKFSPPSLDPLGPCPYPQFDAVDDLTPEPSTDFIEALLAEDDNTPPPSFLAEEEPRITPRRDGRYKAQKKTPPSKARDLRGGKIFGAMLDSIDSARYSNAGTPLLRPSYLPGRRAGR